MKMKKMTFRATYEKRGYMQEDSIKQKVYLHSPVEVVVIRLWRLWKIVNGLQDVIKAWDKTVVRVIKSNSTYTIILKKENLNNFASE